MNQRGHEKTAASPSQRSLAGRIGALHMHARHDPKKTTANGRAAFLARFEDEVDPNQELPKAERIRRSEAAKRRTSRSSRSRAPRPARAAVAMAASVTNHNTKKETHMDLKESYEQTAALFLEHSPMIEVRLVGGGHTFSGFFSNAKSAAEAIAAVDGQRNVYLVANPIKQDAVRGTIGKLGQASNGNCVADSDIEKRGWLLFDIDNKRKGSQSATDAELTSTAAMRDNVLQFLNEQGWPDPLIGFSGNGYWLAYRVDMGNDDQAKELVEEVLQTVAFFFDEEDVKIDPAVANAARLVPFFGTMKMKGENTRERPHRHSEILSFGSRETVITEQIEALVAMLPLSVPPPSVIAGDAWPNLKEVLEAAGINYVISKNGRYTWYNVYGPDGNCPFGDSSGNGGKCGLGQRDDGLVVGHCFAAEHSLAEWLEILEIDRFFPDSLVPTKPVVIVNRSLAEVSDQIWAIIAKKNNPPTLFVYGDNTLVEVI